MTPPVNRLKYGGDQGKTPTRDNPLASDTIPKKVDTSRVKQDMKLNLNVAKGFRDDAKKSDETGPPYWLGNIDRSLAKKHQDEANAQADTLIKARKKNK